MRKLIVTILACFVLSISVVYILAALSNDLRQRPGSFLREFPPHPAIEAQVLDLKVNSYYIAGGTEHHIYLGNYSAPLHLIVANLTLTDTQHVKLVVPGIMDQKVWAVKVQVDSPYFYLTDGVVPFIFKGNVHDWKAERYAHDENYFQDIVPAGETFYVRALSNPERENTLGKINSQPPYMKLTRGILKKQVDGIFCTDGTLHFHKSHNELVYLYRYRNECIIMDTSLNVIRTYHTIDTTTTAKMKIGKIESRKSTTFASPPLTVNNQSSVWDSYLFVNSKLLAKNEHPSAHDESSVIDVYDLQTGSYEFSFYIYDLYGKDKLREFQVFGSKVFTLFKQHLQVWDLSI